MSPERIEAKQYNHTSDIWSFGLIILELATGTYPYKNATFVELLQLVVNEPSPEIPNDDNYSEEFKSFIKKW